MPAGARDQLQEGAQHDGTGDARYTDNENTCVDDLMYGEVFK